MTVLRRRLTSVVTSAATYDYAQKRLSGLDELRRRVRVLTADWTGSVLDVGAGTGNFATAFPPSMRYVALDVDAGKIARLKAKMPEVEAYVASGTALPFDDCSFDHAVCTDVSHHLTDDELVMLFSEIARVVRKEFVFLDALSVPGSRLSRFLWAFDRGRHPREREPLMTHLTRFFDPSVVEVFRITHAYVLVRGAVRAQSSV